MPIIPGSSGGGSGTTFFSGHASSQNLILQSGQETEIIPPSEFPGLRKYWIYNPGQATVFLRGKSIDSQDFVDFPLPPGYIFEDTDNGGPGSGWYGISNENEATLSVHIKSKTGSPKPISIDQDWVKPVVASWQPTDLGIFFVKYSGNGSQSIPVTVQVNTLEPATFFAISALGNNYSEALENNADNIREYLHLAEGGQGTYKWHYDEYPFLVAMYVVGAYDDILIYNMSLNMLSGFPIISLLQSISVY